MKHIKANIEDSGTLSGNFYCSESIFHESIQKIFANSWQLITDDSEVSETNSAYPFVLMEEVLPESLFLINNEQRIKCYSNVCTHRGNILVNKKTVLNNSIVCNYHGKRFDFSGIFISMPESKGMNNFPCLADNLSEVPCDKWRQFVFVSLNGGFKLSDLFIDVNKRVDWMPIEDFRYREDLSKQYIIDANWALYCDNYLEGFHIPFIHKDLHDTLDYNNYEVETFQYSSLQIGYANNEEDCFDLPIQSPDYGKKIAAYYFWLFPNIMLNFYPWGLSINIITPLSHNQTKIEFKSYVWNESMLKKGAGADLNKVELEDQAIVKQVNQGVRSRFYNYGRFSPKMEKGVHHFHNLIKKFMQ